MGKAKKSVSKDKSSAQYARTEANLKRKGKTNKKRHHAGYIAHVR
jgi:hypothetical protein